ncbi:hypothetical protein BGW38_008796, partial [Lunasporangiospora selenospora]
LPLWAGRLEHSQACRSIVTSLEGRIDENAGFYRLSQEHRKIALEVTHERAREKYENFKDVRLRTRLQSITRSAQQENNELLSAFDERVRAEEKRMGVHAAHLRAGLRQHLEAAEQEKQRQKDDRRVQRRTTGDMPYVDDLGDNETDLREEYHQQGGAYDLQE